MNTETGVARTLTTNDSGVYDAVSIIPGNYRVTFSKDGFDKLVRSGIELTANAISIDGQLHVGTSQTEVQVTEQAPLLKTETVVQATSLDRKNHAAIA